jgi:hypothetical protein
MVSVVPLFGASVKNVKGPTEGPAVKPEFALPLLASAAQTFDHKHEWMRSLHTSHKQIPFRDWVTRDHVAGMAADEADTEKCCILYATTADGWW